MPKYGFIDPADWVPGKIYGTRPDENCSKYLYLEGVFRTMRELKIAATGQILDAETPYPYIFLKWLPIYKKYLHRSTGWNQIFHDLVDLTANGPHRQNWRRNLHVQDYRPNSEHTVKFNREIGTLFDPDAVTPEVITDGWRPCMLEAMPPTNAFFLCGYRVNDDDGTIPGFVRDSILIKPWHGPWPPNP